MKTRIDITIHKNGGCLSDLSRMIGHANERGGGLSLVELRSWVNVSKIELPYTRGDWDTLTLSPISLAISEDKGKTYVATLTWVELHELQSEETSSPFATEGPNEPKTGDAEDLPFGLHDAGTAPKGWDIQ